MSKDFMVIDEQSNNPEGFWDKYDLSDFDEFLMSFIKNNHAYNIVINSEKDKNKLRQYIQSKIDQAIKKRDEEWKESLDTRNDLINNINL